MSVLNACKERPGKDPYLQSLLSINKSFTYWHFLINQESPKPDVLLFYNSKKKYSLYPNYFVFKRKCQTRASAQCRLMMAIRIGCLFNLQEISISPETIFVADFVKKSHQSKSLASYCNVAVDCKKRNKSHFFISITKMILRRNCHTHHSA